jgi:hypothetical protein
VSDSSSAPTCGPSHCPRDQNWSRLEPLDLLEQLLRVARRVVPDNFLRIAVVDHVNVLAQLRPGLGLELLHPLQAAGGHKGAPRGNIVREDLGKLSV